MRYKGRGVQINPHNKFFAHQVEVDPEYLEYCLTEDEQAEDLKTKYVRVFPKTIITKNDSPDVGFDYSINPYQGCEHGCAYCYARNTHEYWGYSAGKDFERVILYKPTAPLLLKQTFQKKNWEPKMIMLSGNTDCYQPAERKFKITRGILETCLKHKHPVGIITKNSLIVRDLEILTQLNALNLLRVTLSITTLNEELRRKMEPRTASVKQRLKTLQILSDAGIQVNVNMAPIIPGLNAHEIFEMVKTIAQHGAYSAIYLMVRLNGHIGPIFEDWVREAYPERANKVLNQIKHSHGGRLNDSRFKTRMRGEGQYAEMTKATFARAIKEFMPKREREPLDLEIFDPFKNDQMRLF